MVTLPELFLVNQIIQALCPITKIWMEAKIIGFEGSWAVRILFTKWLKKHKWATVQVNQEDQMKDWPIRKTIRIEEAWGKRQRRRARPIVDYNPELKTHLEVIFLLNQLTTHKLI